MQYANQELFLVEFENVLVVPPCNLASKEPLGVAPLVMVNLVLSSAVAASDAKTESVARRMSSTLVVEIVTFLPWM